MKCHKPGTDQSAEVTVLLNGSSCTEYALPGQPRDPNVVECVIPVHNGDHITISGEFTGTVLHASFDLLADGAFVGDRRIEGSKTGQTKYYKNRRLDFKTFFNVPEPTDRMGEVTKYSPDNVVEGDLVVVPSKPSNGHRESTSSKPNPFPGCLVVVASITLDPSESYCTGSYPSMTCGRSSDQGAKNTGGAGDDPTYQLEIQTTNAEVSAPRQRHHKRHFLQSHFGKREWAKFVFYYRSVKEVEKAGCKKLADHSYALSDTARSQSPTTSHSGRMLDAAMDPRNYSNSASQASSVSTKRNAEAIVGPSAQQVNYVPCSEVPAKKKKLFGQALPADVSIMRDRQHTPPQGSNNDFEALIRDYRQDVAKESVTTACHNKQADSDGRQHTSLDLQDIDFTEEDLAKAIDNDDWMRDIPGMAYDGAIADPQAWNDDILGAAAFSAAIDPEVRVTASLPGNGPIHEASSSLEEGDIDEGELLSSRHRNQAKESFKTPPAASAMQSSSGMRHEPVNLQENAWLMYECRGETIGADNSTEVTGQHLNVASPEVVNPATKTRTSEHDGPRKKTNLPNPWNPASETTRHSMSQSSVERALFDSISRNQHHQEQQEANDKINHRIAPNQASNIQHHRARHSQSNDQENPSIDTRHEHNLTIETYDGQADTAQRSAQGHTITSDHPEASKVPLTPVSVLERAVSSDPTSRDDTPNGVKASNDNLFARKAMLLQQLEEKKQRKLAARTAFEELQRRRDEEQQKRQEIAMREIQILEKLATEEDEEFEQLEAAKKIAETEMREAREAREAAEEALQSSEAEIA